MEQQLTKIHRTLVLIAFLISINCLVTALGFASLTMLKKTTITDNSVITDIVFDPQNAQQLIDISKQLGEINHKLENKNSK